MKNENENENGKMNIFFPSRVCLQRGGKKGPGTRGVRSGPRSFGQRNTQVRILSLARRPGAHGSLGPRQGPGPQGRGPRICSNLMLAGYLRAVDERVPEVPTRLVEGHSDGCLGLTAR